MEIDLNEAVAAWRLVLIWLLVGVAGLAISILTYLWAMGR